MVGVYDEGVHPGAQQMIERKRDKRLLEDWNKRFRQIFRQRTEAGTEPCTEDKRLRDHTGPRSGDL